MFYHFWSFTVIQIQDSCKTERNAFWAYFLPFPEKVSMFQTYHFSLHRIKNIRFSCSANQVLQWWQYSLHNRLCEDVEKVSTMSKMCFLLVFHKCLLAMIDNADWGQLHNCAIVFLIWSRYKLGLAMRLQMMRISRCMRLYPHICGWCACWSATMHMSMRIKNIHMANPSTNPEYQQF